MIRYQNIYGYSINFTPWLDLGYRLVSVELQNTLGGTLAGGTIRLVGTQSNLPSLELKENLYSGTVSILNFGVTVKEFKVFFVRKTYKREELALDFVCIPDPKYVRDLHTKTHKGNLQNIIEDIFSSSKEFLDIRCTSDIQGIMRMYQSNQSDIDFLKNILSGYKRNCVFGYSWDRLILKETCTPEEMNSAKVIEAVTEEQSPASNSYDKGLYSVPRNLWEEGKDDLRVGEDYTDRQAINVRASSIMEGKVEYMGTEYYNMVNNSKKNIINLSSDYFQKLTITLKTLPDYQIGDVVRYYRNDNQVSDMIWPYEYYMVYANRMFFATSGTGVTDPTVPKDLGDYTFTTVLVGLEEDGSIALDKTEEQDPTIEEQGDPNYIKNTKASDFLTEVQNSAKQQLPKITEESLRAAFSNSKIESLKNNTDFQESFIQYSKEQGFIKE
jgi:hypothetical protein